MDKKKVVVLFGGQSSEHEISCISATTIIENMNQEIYDVLLIGITKDGRWIKVDTVEQIKNHTWTDGKVTAVISPDAAQGGVLLQEGSQASLISADVVFPVLHGLYGEDGTVQGLLELARIPYVGCGVLSSAVSMDKLYTKIIVDTLGIRQARYVAVLKPEMADVEQVMDRVEQKLAYPVFVKPSNAGSSKGISKAHNRQELKIGLEQAVLHDRKILVEEAITGRELECAVLGGKEPRASGVGEIVAATDFYDYDAKYNSMDSMTVISPELPEGVEAQIRKAAVDIFMAVDGFSLARVDFFLEKETNQVVFNEINTLPGFTSISMYPMLWEAKGISKSRLVEKLIQTAFLRA